MLYFHHPSSLEHDPRLLSPDHPDTPERISAIETAMAEVGWLGCDVRDAPAAVERELELVHTASHVQAIRDLCAAGGGQIDSDTFVAEASYRVNDGDDRGARGCGNGRILRAGSVRDLARRRPRRSLLDAVVRRRASRRDARLAA